MKKTIPSFAALFAAAAAAIAAGEKEPVELEPAGRDDPAWRLSVGLRSAPRVKTRAAVDSGAAVRAVGCVQPPSAPARAPVPASRLAETAPSGTDSPETTLVTVSETTSSTQGKPTVSGTTVDDAVAASGYREGTARYEFDNGYIDTRDAAGIPGETTNWHFDDAAAFDGNRLTISGTKGYSSTETTVRTDIHTTTRTETTINVDTRVSRREMVTGGGVSTSVSEKWFDPPSDDSSDGAAGLDLKLSRTMWEDDDFGLEIGAGWTLYRDIDCFRSGGRVYEGCATTTRHGETKTTETTITRTTTTRGGGDASTRTTTETIETTTVTTRSGEVATVISQPEFQDLSDIQNPDGSIGGATYDGLPSQPGWGTPVLTVTPDRFSVENRPNETTTRTSTTTSTTTTGGESGGSIPTSVSQTSETRRDTVRGRDVTAVATRTVDVKSRGELSMQELRLGLSPFWKATDRILVRGDVGVIGAYVEVETRTTILVNGETASSSTHMDDDWALQGYAGLELAWRATECFELSSGAEFRFPKHRVKFDDGIVSGSVELPKWDVTVRASILF